MNTFLLEEGEYSQASEPEFPAETKIGMLWVSVASLKTSSRIRDLGPLKERLISDFPGMATSMICERAERKEKVNHWFNFFYSLLPCTSTLVVPMPDLSKIFTA